MKRVILSVIGGAVIPICYLLVAGLLFSRTTKLALHQALGMPINWPVHLYQYIFNLHIKPGFEFEVTSLLVFTIVGNVILYALLTYLVLWAISTRKQLARPS